MIKTKTIKYIEINELQKYLKENNPEFFKGGCNSTWHDYTLFQRINIGNGNYGTLYSYQENHEELMDAIDNLGLTEDVLLKVYW